MARQAFRFGDHSYALNIGREVGRAHRTEHLSLPHGVLRRKDRVARKKQGTDAYAELPAALTLVYMKQKRR